jgi:Txe/YoeB family toxin of toxin-antitoxin system
VSWRVVFSRQAQKDARKLASASPALKQRAQELIDLLAEGPWRSPPPFETLVGDLRGAYSRRINIQHRLVYSVEADQQLVKVLRLWSHYD